MKKADGKTGGSPADFAELNALIEQEKEENRSFEDARRLPQKHMEEYRYFDCESLAEGLYAPSKAIKKAGALLGADEMLPARISFGHERGEQGLVGHAVGGTRDGGERCSIDFNRTRVTATTCNNWRCGYERNRNDTHLGYSLCPHEVALFQQIVSYLRENNPGDTTSEAGLSLMQKFKQTLPAKIEKASDIIKEVQTLCPVLEENADGAFEVSFRIGSRRLYKVKNLKTFVKNMQEHGALEISQKTTLPLGRELLSKESLKWLDYIEKRMADEEQRKKYEPSPSYGSSYFYRGSADSGKLPLYGSYLDAFYDCMGKDVIEYTRYDYYGNQKGHITAKEASLRITLEIHKDVEASSGIFQGVLLSGKIPATISSLKYAYYISHSGMELSYFNRIGEEESKKIAPILEASSDGEIRMTIGRTRLAEFYRSTVPALRNLVDLVEYDAEEIESYLPPDPVFTSFLDVSDGSIICHAKVSYGQQEHSLTDLAMEDGSERRQHFQSYRNLEAEGQVTETLLRYLPNVDQANMIFYASREDEQVFDFLDRGLDELIAVSEVRTTERFRRLGLRRHASFSLGVSVDGSLMDLSITSDDLSPEELLDLLYAYRQKRRFIRLKSGDFFKIDENETLQQLEEMMTALNLSPSEFVKGKMHLPMYRALYLDKMLEKATQDIYADRDRTFRKLIKEFKAVEDADIEIPSGLKNVLRKYQEAGYRWLYTLDSYHFGGILADEMGLGKTLQVITAILEENSRPDGEKLPSLVVCPSSLVYNWGEEFAKYAPSLSVTLITGLKKEREALLARYDRSDVLVTSYDLLKRDIDLYEGKEFRFEVIDEAQYIKNQMTAAAKSVKLVNSRTRFALTGTPIENRLSELWSIFDYLMPGFLYDYPTFQADFELPIVKYQIAEASERLQKMVTPFILRRLKMDVLKDLPEKLEEVRYARMEDKQQKIYDAQVVRMKKKVQSQDEKEFRQSRIEILAELTKIRQICCDPTLLLENYDGGSAKRETCMELIRSVVEGEHKALLFSQFTSMLSLLEEDLQKEGIPYYKITGATPKEKRLEMVKAFNADSTPLFLISLKAGGTGLNLTGADVVIHYDPWWNIAVQNQATDRAHRIGQTKVVTVYKLIIKNTIEEKILAMQESKKKLAEDILGGEAIANSSISREDLLALLE